MLKTKRIVFLGLLLGLSIKCQVDCYKTGDINKSIQENNLLREYRALHIVGLSVEETNFREYLESCLKMGADVNQTDTEGNTFLDYAIYGDDIQIVEILCRYGVDLNEYDKNKMTPLSKVINEAQKKCYYPNHCAEILEIMIKHGADVNKVYGANAFTPLHEAAWYGFEEIVKILLSHGADVNIHDQLDRVPLWYAGKVFFYQKPLSQDTLRLLASKTICINKIDRRGETLFRHHLPSRNIEIIRGVLRKRLEKSLIEYGIDLDSDYYVESLVRANEDTLSNEAILGYYVRYGCVNIVLVEKVLNEVLQSNTLDNREIAWLFHLAVKCENFTIASLIRSKCNEILINVEDEFYKKCIEKAFVELDTLEEKRKTDLRSEAAKKL